MEKTGHGKKTLSCREDHPRLPNDLMKSSLIELFKSVVEAVSFFRCCHVDECDPALAAFVELYFE